MTRNAHLEQVASDLVVRRTGVASLMKDIVGEHLSVQRVLADLQDMLHVDQETATANNKTQEHSDEPSLRDISSDRLRRISELTRH